jgi:hypothetical protein
MRTLFFIGVVLASASFPIIRRADRPDTRYLEAGAKYPAVVALGRRGDATLVAPQWLLTAGHVANSIRPGLQLHIAGGTYDVSSVIVHPEWRELGPHDVGLVRLSRPVASVRPLGVYRGRLERGLVATIVGHGATGRGDSRERADDGRARAATSRVDSTTADWLYFSFDAPPAGTDLEGAPGPGDSGGPAVIRVGGQALVAGVSSAGFDGRHGPGSYGAVDAFTRVSTHAAWIDSVMRAGPAPARDGSSASQRPVSSQGVSIPDTPVGERAHGVEEKRSADDGGARRQKSDGWLASVGGV